MTAVDVVGDVVEDCEGDVVGNGVGDVVDNVVKYVLGDVLWTVPKIRVSKNNLIFLLISKKLKKIKKI